MPTFKIVMEDGAHMVQDPVVTSGTCPGYVSLTSFPGSRCPFSMLSWKTAPTWFKIQWQKRNSLTSPVQNWRNYWRRRIPQAGTSSFNRSRIAATLIMFASSTSQGLVFMFHSCCGRISLVPGLDGCFVKTIFAVLASFQFARYPAVYSKMKTHLCENVLSPCARSHLQTKRLRICNRKNNGISVSAVSKYKQRENTLKYLQRIAAKSDILYFQETHSLLSRNPRQNETLANIRIVWNWATWTNIGALTLGCVNPGIEDLLSWLVLTSSVQKLGWTRNYLSWTRPSCTNSAPRLHPCRH